MRATVVLPLLVLAAACQEAPSERPAAPVAKSAFPKDAPAAAPDTVPRAVPAPPADAEGITVSGTVHASLPGYTVTLLPTGLDGTVRALRVRAAGVAGAQDLPVSEELGTELFQPAERLRLDDVDFDGYADLEWVTQTTPSGNSRADYWRFDPAAGRFVGVGNFPVFTVDPAGRALRARHKGGHAGLIFSDETYRWIGGKPVLVRVEHQDLDAASEAYVRTVKELRGGKLVETGRRVLTGDEAIAEASAQ